VDGTDVLRENSRHFQARHVRSAFLRHRTIHPDMTANVDRQAKR
jgi:hypothetical protein